MIDKACMTQDPSKKRRLDEDTQASKSAKQPRDTHISDDLHDPFDDDRFASSPPRKAAQVSDSFLSSPISGLQTGSALSPPKGRKSRSLSLQGEEALRFSANQVTSAAMSTENGQLAELVAKLSGENAFLKAQAEGYRLANDRLSLSKATLERRCAQLELQLQNQTELECAETL